MAEKKASGEGEGEEGDQEGAEPSGAAGARQKGTRKKLVSNGGPGCWYIFGFSRSVVGQVVELRARMHYPLPRSQNVLPIKLIHDLTA